MHDIFDKEKTLEGWHVKRLFLSPSQWTKRNLPVELTWTSIKFTEKNKERIPKGSHGVYTFVAIPEIANHDACAYLLYVGKADKRTFRDRYGDYLYEKRLGDKTRRVNLEPLWQLGNFLWFYYAPVAKEHIEKVEDELLMAYIPPTNDKFPAKIRDAVERLFR
jgi:hypothetical protein